MLIFCLISKVQKAQCAQNWDPSTPTTVTLCSLPLNLSIWIGPGAINGVFTTSAGFIVSSVYFSTLAAGSYIITYTETGCAATSHVLHVINTNQVTILADGVSMSKKTNPQDFVVTLSVENSSYYLNYEWYKNGFVVGTGSTYTTDDMGTYTLKSANLCGPVYYDDIEIACDCDLAGLGASNIGTTGMTTNRTTDITGSNMGGIGQSNTNFDFVIKGTMFVPKGATVHITDANIRMEACASIVLETGTGVTPGGIIIIDNSTITGCDKWQGVRLAGSGAINTSPLHPIFDATTNGFEISDAYKALYATNGGRLVLDGVAFENNENDITMRDYANDYTPTLTNLDIKGKWIHNDIANFCTLSGTYVTPSSNTYKKMIYLEAVHEFDITHCTFTGNDFPSGVPYVAYQTNAIELYDMEDVNVDDVEFNEIFNAGIYGQHVTNTISGPPGSAVYSINTNYLFNNYLFEGFFYYGIYFLDGTYITLGDLSVTPTTTNRFLGDFVYGTYLDGCSNTLQYGNIFNSNSYGSPSAAGGDFGANAVFYNLCHISYLQKCLFQSVTDAVLFVDCTTPFIVENDILYSDLGVQFYSDNDVFLTTIAENRFVGNNYGLIISPTANPLSPSQTNTIQYELLINISCNFFLENYYAIVGSGLIMDQGTDMGTNGNKWESNIEWDWLWEDIGAAHFKYYSYDAGNPTINPSNRPNAWNGLGMYSIYVNGVSGSPIEFDDANTDNNDDQYINGCYDIITSPGVMSGIKASDPIDKIHINNPVSSELAIKGCQLKDQSIICYDALGKSHNLSLLSFADDIFRFDTSTLAAGMYYITINNQTLKFMKL